MSDQLMEIFSREELDLENEDLETIYAQTVHIKSLSDARLDWTKVRNLFVGDLLGAQTRALYLSNSKSLPAYFLSHNGSWLIISGYENQLGEVLSLCAEKLHFLRIEEIAEPNLISSTRKQYSHLREMYSDPWLRINPEIITSEVYSFNKTVELEYLYIDGSFGITSLDVSHMKELKSLKIFHNRTLHTIRGISDLRNLKEIKLLYDYNLSFFSLHNQENLESLILCRLNQFEHIPNLQQCPKLRELRVVVCSLVDSVIDLSEMYNLQIVDISGNSSLHSIKGVEDLKRLKVLDISGTTIHDIPDALRGKPLRHLNLEKLELNKLPDWLPEFGLEFSVKANFPLLNMLFERESRKQYIAGISLYGTTVKDVDMSIFSQSQEMILQWFEERKKGSEVQLNEIKVVFLGDGEAGKSHTIARLLSDGGDPIDYTDKATPGIVIKTKDYQQEGRKFRVHFWDFGGQEILHSMHRIFLTERTLYVVLVNARDETQDARARYWLHNIKSFAQDAPVILVLNKMDQNPKANVNERDLRERYPNLKQVVKMSALEYDRERFNREFRDLLLDEIRQTGFLDVMWPQSWTKVKSALVNMKQNYIRGNDYRQICRECSVDKNEKNLLHWFNDLGVSFCCCDDYRLENYVILRPAWITNALYIILFNQCPGARNGLVPHQSIHSLLSAGDEKIHRVLPNVYYNWDEISYVLEVFHKSQLSFDAGDQNEFIPMLCDPNSSPVAQEYQQDEHTLEFQMEFDYLPNNLLHQLMVDRKAELQMEHVWRTGALFAQPETGLSAVVTIDGNILKILVRHTDDMHRPNTYLAMLKANVDRIWKKMGLQEPMNALVYKLDGKQDVFDYDRLKDMLRDGEEREYSRIWRRRLDIRDILNQAAPAELEEQSQLLRCIVRSCLNIQGDMRYRGSPEDDRNNRVRDDLEFGGYVVRDQTRRGSSASSRNPGELDIEIRTKEGRPWTIVEALRIYGTNTDNWDAHLEKLLGKYNSHGAPFLFLLSYVDCRKERFDNICDSFEGHMQRFDPGEFAYVKGSCEPFRGKQWEHDHFIRTVRCRYSCGGYDPTVYHIFVLVEK